jgi:hypothetical protein
MTAHAAGSGEFLRSTRLVSYDYDPATGLLTATVRFTCTAQAEVGRVHIGVIGTTGGQDYWSTSSDGVCDSRGDVDTLTATISNLSDIEATEGDRIQLWWFVEQTNGEESDPFLWESIERTQRIRL